MANYREMYLSMYRTVTDAIEMLQEAQLKTEEMYISAPATNISALDIADTSNTGYENRSV